MKKLEIFTLFFFLIFTISCEKDNVEPINLERLNGYVQKGPYLNGTAITISELTQDLVPTGKNFSSQILDNKGTFEIKNIELNSQYIELKANGFYYNEVSNENSSAQLTLFALSNLNDKSSLNVNVLSNLEKSRVDYLVSNDADFSSAKKQAQSEILAIFNITKDNISNSELLDITKTGDDNAILLAISVILQGHLTVSELSELLANISTDIREDGLLNSQTTGSTLVNNAKTIKLDIIRDNLESKYEAMGLDITIPDFEGYVNKFIEQTDFEFTASIEFPTSGEYGHNILDKEKTEYTQGTYSMKAVLPKGTSIKVKVSGNHNWYFPAFQENTGWEYSSWNEADYSRVFSSTRTGELDFEMLFSNNDSLATKVYVLVYENGDESPTWTKEISIINEFSQVINYPMLGQYGANILAMETETEISDTSTYSIAIELPEEPEYYAQLKVNNIDGDGVSWDIDLSKLSNWDGSPNNGEEIKIEGKGITADVPINFSGSGKVEIQLEAFKIGSNRDTYMGTKHLYLNVVDD